jgi:hypothetical protein
MENDEKSEVMGVWMVDQKMKGREYLKMFCILCP